ncbi:hypothetical protein Leryth_005223 [Lithospermum erythrorhizon]|nr:hypothetical protein Leryth_005223 [Lithospermum erythrorhizon]
METQTSDSIEDITSIKDSRQQLESRIDTLRNAQIDLIASLQPLVPDIVSSLDLSLKVISTFSGCPFVPLPKTLPKPKDPKTLQIPRFHHNEGNNEYPCDKNVKFGEKNECPCDKKGRLSGFGEKDECPSDKNGSLVGIGDKDLNLIGDERDLGEESGDPLPVVRALVAVCLLERVPFTAIDSSTVLRKLENDQSVIGAERAALREVGGETGPILAVEMALRAIAEDNGGVELEEFVVSGKSRVMVMNIDRTRLLREMPESKQMFSQNEGNCGMESMGVNGGGVYGMGRPMQDMWMGGPGDHPHMPGLPPMFHGGMGPRGGPRGMVGMMGVPRGVGVPPPMHRPPMGPGMPVPGMNSASSKPKSEEDEMKDLEALLNKKSFRELQKSKTGEELLDLIHRPTAKENAMAARFKSKGGSQVKEYCSALTKEDCRRQSGSYSACEKVHFRRIIALHTDVNLGDCSFLDTCRHMKTCKYVHYELDSTPDVPPMMIGGGALAPGKALKPPRADYCSEVELGEAQWINCDIRSFRMDILGNFGVIMADPPWDIHMELPYGTMADDEMRTLNVPALQTDGLIFLWVTGRAMELGRECLDLWGYKCVEEIIWVKTNQLQRIIRTGRTGHWLNHSKEHCLVGIKGNPEVNRNIDTDVIVAEVRETSRKPDELLHIFTQSCSLLLCAISMITLQC